MVQRQVKLTDNILFHMYNGVLGAHVPWPHSREAQALDGLTKLPELQKCDWNPCLSGGMGQGLSPLPEKFLMHGVDLHPSLSYLPLLMSHRTQDYLCGLGGRELPPPCNIVPGWSHPGSRP